MCSGDMNQQNVCQPSVVLVPETVPQDFDDVNDGSEMDSEQVDCSVEHSSDVASHDGDQTATVVSPCSPVFSRPCQPALRVAPVPIHVSPSLFDDDEEKRSHQINMMKNLTRTCATASYTGANLSQPSPSVLSRKLAQQQIETYNCDSKQEATSPLQSGGSLQNTTEMKIRGKTKQSSSEVLTNGLDAEFIVDVGQDTDMSTTPDCQQHQQSVLKRLRCDSMNSLDADVQGITLVTVDRLC